MKEKRDREGRKEKERRGDGASHMYPSGLSLTLTTSVKPWCALASSLDAEETKRTQMPLP